MNKLKLNRLSDQKLAEKQMNSVKGGESSGPSNCPNGCCCSCAYANSGGSSTADNYAANTAKGLASIHGCLPTFEITVPKI